MMYVWLLVGFALLIKGADIFVDGASGIAKKLKIPSVVIGLTVVAMGTSAPEAAVSITAGLEGNSDISLGNIIGSNIFNLLMVIGVCAVICTVPSPKDILHRDMIWNIGITAALLVMCIDGKIGRIDGALLLIGIIVYLIFVIRNAMKNRTTEEEEKKISVLKAIIFIVLGLIAIIIGGKLVVNNASLIAKTFGMSDTLIGLTIVAVGTSLPELVTSIVASVKKDPGIAMGNAVGSCIFNILFILGAASVITPINCTMELLIDTGILIGVSVLMLIFAGTKKSFARWEGIICIILYIAYTTFIIVR